MPRKLLPEEQKNLDDCLIEEARDGDVKTVQTLLASGADIHAQDDLALCWAAEKGRTSAVQMLLTAGANVHEQDGRCAMLPIMAIQRSCRFCSRTAPMCM